MKILAKYIGTDGDFGLNSAYIFQYCVNIETGKIQLISFMQKEFMIVEYESKEELDKEWEITSDLDT